MFVRVIPLLRTPIGVDVFDYRAPTTFDVQVGDLVVVSFRRQKIVGIVQALTDKSVYAEKAAPILALYGGFRMPLSFLPLLYWTAERTFSSLPSVLHAWLRELPKKIPTNQFPFIAPVLTSHAIQTHWTATPEQDLLARAKELLAEGKRVLILSPWKTRMERLQAALPESLCLQSDQSMGLYAATWQTFAQKTGSCLIATRIGAWLMPFAEYILLDEPENDDHKQDELAPRYDVRKMAAWMATIQGVPLEAFGITPALHVNTEAPEIVGDIRIFVRHPRGRSAIPCIQADVLTALQEHEGPRTIVHPIRGLLARLTCRDCSWQAQCPTCGYGIALDKTGPVCRLCKKNVDVPDQCPTCGNVDLGKSFPGIDRLKIAWETQGEGTEVSWRDLSNEQLDAPFAPNTFVLVTLASMLGGGTEDIRRHERQCVALRRLAARVAEAQGILALQGEEHEVNVWLSWLTPAGLQILFEAERTARKLFRYPPSIRRIKLILDLADREARAWQTRVAPLLPATLAWDGPYPTVYGTVKQRKRTIWHLLADPLMSEAEIIALLTPFAKEAKIDLDPIAFFK